ncbi:hypothetical protein X928_01555 [Petrotoga miotherma DSM 10691]|uniref:Uncharacterized protein n=1 Tax=Petrotoga miotherma DSM 10691 TaxID=1434326 RepID=A0A2K1PGX4_9BACT|nr:hypothetical protein X928_01555 [Petrotoga miotherma DSM 10691]
MGDQIDKQFSREISIFKEKAGVYIDEKNNEI